MDRPRSRERDRPRSDHRSKRGSPEYGDDKYRSRRRSPAYEDDNRNRRYLSPEPDHGSSRRRREPEDDRDEEHKEKKRKRERSVDRAERKAVKSAKSARHREDEELARQQVAELSIYSATDNPFHDANLGSQFKWHKKAEKEKKMGMSAAEAQRRDALRRQEAKEELERLNKRRAEREIEQQLREEEESRMARLADSAQMAEWIAKEGDFQLEQERKRAGIRLKEKRAKAIDFLTLNLKYAGGDTGEDDDMDLDAVGLEIDFDEPYAIFESLTLEQTEELHEDILRYLGLEKSETNIDFWTSMMVVCKDRLEKLRDEQQNGRANTAVAAVEGEVSALLSGKTYNQLLLLQKQVQAKLNSGEPVDVDYWEGLLKSILVWKAKAKLKDTHEVVVKNRLEQLRKRQRDEALQAQKELLSGVNPGAVKGWGGDMRAEATQSETVVEGGVREDEEPEHYARAMSPALVDPARLRYEDRQLDIVDETEDKRALFAMRRAVTASRFIAKVNKTILPEVIPEQASGADLESEALYREAASKELSEDEEDFNWEEIIALPSTYNWEDKYRPRKPRYFNRVHTGYEWNKYNQTHYDTDNPPPKVVQGYKFNIFYPDLIDKSKAPTYKIIKDPNDPETVLLLFQAGPPYEDVAFKIVNREWEYSHKRGFRSSFDRGCLSLWFNFRRNFYRK